MWSHTFRYLYVKSFFFHKNIFLLIFCISPFVWATEPLYVFVVAKNIIWDQNPRNIPQNKQTVQNRLYQICRPIKNTKKSFVFSHFTHYTYFRPQPHTFSATLPQHCPGLPWCPSRPRCQHWGANATHASIP